jgi:NADPH:quinone reductase-like Zn-dependent oxidoreductase
VLELTDGKGVDLALEMSWADIEKTTEAMAFGGRIAVVGLLGGASAELSVFGVMLKSLTIIGVQAGSKASFEQMNEAIIQHNIKPVIDTVFPLSNVVGAFHYFDGGNHFGKVVLSFKD